jgi:PAS domain S-box-containing protein
MPKAKIMIVEDETIVARDIQKSVEAMGYLVCAVASSGKEAIQKADETRPDLALMDIVLKGAMDGVEAAGQIGARFKIPIVYLTAYDDEDILQRAKTTTPYAYITKPFNDRELHIAIEMALYKSQAETKIRKVEQRLAAVLRSVGDAVIASDKEGQVTFMNPTAEKLTGWKQEEAFGKKLTEVLNIREEELKGLEKHLVEKVIAQGLIINLLEDHMLVAKDRTETLISDSAAPIRDDDGETSGTVLVFRDVSERKKAEDALIEAAREWQITFDSTNDAIWILDQDNRILRANKTAEHFFHRPLGEMIGKHCWKIVHGTEQPIPECPILRMRKNLNRESMELQAAGERWFEVNVDPILDAAGRYLGAVHIVSDITERKQAEEALRKSEANYRQLFDNSPSGIYKVDFRTGKFLKANDAMCKYLGYGQEEITSLSLYDVLTDESKQLFSERLNKMMRREEVAENPEFEIVDNEGKRRWVQLNTKYFYDSEGLAGADVVAHEITERKQMEKQLQDTLESLRKAVGTTIQVMVSAVETRDPYTSGHQSRSSDLARAITAEMGLPQDKIEGVRMAGSIHDIGKLSIPAEILSKPTKLTDIEFALIKEHAEKGYELLKDVESPWPLADIVYQHHERMDGSGYPRNLKGEEILIEARILAVADVVEAMASHRPYRPGLGIAAVLEEIEKNSGIFYDNTVAEACLRLFREKGFKLEGT